MPTAELLRRADERVHAIPVPTRPTVFVHGDVWPGNTVLAGDTARALIDWKTAGVGNPGVDLGELRKQVAIGYGEEAPKYDLPADGRIRRKRRGRGRPVVDPAVEGGLFLDPDRAAGVGQYATGHRRRGASRANDEGRQPHRDAHAGQLSLCRSLITAELVDRFRVVVFPVVTGATGQDRIYDGYPDIRLDLVQSCTFDGGLQLLEYVPTCSTVRQVLRERRAERGHRSRCAPEC
jgi:hypothetical protein